MLPAELSLILSVALVFITKSCASVVPIKLVAGLVAALPDKAQLVEPAAPDVCQMGAALAPCETRICPVEPAKLLGIRALENLIFPTMTNFSVGAVVPIPTFPLYSMVILSNRVVPSFVLKRRAPELAVTISFRDQASMVATGALVCPTLLASSEKRNPAKLEEVSAFSEPSMVNTVVAPASKLFKLFPKIYPVLLTKTLSKPRVATPICPLRGE